MSYLNSQNWDLQTLILIPSILPLALTLFVYSLRLLYERKMIAKMQERSLPPGLPQKEREIQEILKRIEPKLWRIKFRIFIVLSLISLVFIFWQIRFYLQDIIIDEQIFIILVIASVCEFYQRIMRHRALESYFTSGQNIFTKAGNILAIIIVVAGGYALLAFNPIAKEISANEIVRSENFACATNRIGRYGGIADPSKYKCVYQKYGFELIVPSDGRKIVRQADHIRMQNYEGEWPYLLKPGEYFFEVSIYDHSENKFLNESCEMLFKDETGQSDAEIVQTGEADALKGTLPGGGDAHPRPGLCYDGKKFDIVFSVQEGEGTDPSITDAVLESVFIKSE